MHSLSLAAAISLGTAMLALFMALPLLALARHRPASAWLAGLVFSIGALSFCDSEVLRRQLFGLFDWPVAALGAFYYCYVRSLGGLGNGRLQALHFLPALVAAGVFVWLHQQLALVPRGGETSPAWDSTFDAIVFTSQGITVAYIGAVFWRLHQHRARVRECFSTTDQRDLAWLAWLTGATLALLLVWLPATTLGGNWAEALRIGRVLLLCFIGWYGIRQAPVFVPSIASAAPGLVAAEPTLPPLDAAGAPGAVAAAEPDRAKYARSGMTDAAAELIGKRLEHRMTVARDYLESDIALAQLAERIGTSPQLLSQYLNHVMGLSFFDYINGLRVVEVQRALRESANTGQPLLQLAFAAGFNSKSTFNAAFKKLAGVAPSAWRSAQLAAASEPIR